MSEPPLDEIDFRAMAFSQEGEDLFLNRIFHATPTGVYVDVGAHHPFRFSNTYALYKRGWHGINIDPGPGVKALFDACRPRDINLDHLMTDRDGEEIAFDLYTEPAMNSAVAARRQNLEHLYVGSERRTTARLDTVLGQHLPPSGTIDLLTIDVEGLDFQVLRANDWRRYRPSVVLVEEPMDLERFAENQLCQFMKEVGYVLRSYLYSTAAFMPVGANPWG